MGNSHSMNNLSLIDHKRQTTEFLRYSQIPYESQHRQQDFRDINNLPKPIKVLPDVKFEPKLRSTNNGQILQSGGTISGRKESECGLHRSKSISETNPNDIFALPTPFKMQRASTQLSIIHTPKNIPEKNKSFNSQEVRRSRITPSPVNRNIQPNNIKKENNPPRVLDKRLFGDTLTKRMESNMIVQSKPLLRREKTFDMTLIHSIDKDREMSKPKFSPQIDHRKKEMPAQERNKINLKSYNNGAIMSHRPSNNEKMKTIDRKSPRKKINETEKSVPSMSSNNNNNNEGIGGRNAIRNSKNSHIPQMTKKQEINENLRSKPNILKQQQQQRSSNPKIIRAYSKEVLNLHEQTVSEEINTTKENVNMSISSMSENQVAEKNHAHNDVINKFAEEVTRMGSSFDTSPVKVQSEREKDEDIDILVSLRPTLPRKQLQIPHFSPLVAWKSLSTEINMNDAQQNTDLLQIAHEDLKLEKKIEKVYREPSFNLHFIDNKSGDSGISADKEIGTSPDIIQPMPQAYLISSWTPQQDLEEDEESVDENFIQSNGNSIENSSSNNQPNNVAFKSPTFSLSLPRENQFTITDKLDYNNFYSLQKFKKAVVDVFDTITSNSSETRNQYQTADNNWLLGSQPNSIDELTTKKERERNQIISHMKSGKHVMYLPSHWNEEKMKYVEMKNCNGNSNSNNNNDDDDTEDYLRNESNDNNQLKQLKNHRFKFQSTMRQVERRKIAEKLSKEAEEKEMQRLCELEAMQKVEEEFQKKRIREKNRLRQQLRIASLEQQNCEPHHYSEREVSNVRRSTNKDTRTPYISKLVEARSSKKI